MSRYATITVIGRDKTGVVARVTNLLFESRANIEALEEQVTRGQFSMTLQASWRVSRFDEKALGQGLRALGRELGMEIKWWFTDPKRPQRMALMVTREPHCLDAILESVKSRKLKTEIVAVVGNHRDLKAKVEKAGLPFHHVAWTNRAKAEAKAKAMRPIAEKVITKAKKGGLHNHRQVVSFLRDKEMTAKLFDEIGPRYADRPGGYTRVLKVGPRHGDNAPMARIELV